MRPLHPLPLALLSLAFAQTVLADEISVSPGKDTITAALAKAKAGDTVKVAAGEYAESVEVPADVTLEGAGADKTTLTGVKYATVNCTGPHVRITGLTIKASADGRRGVNTSGPVRIERCRFVKIPEAVAMMGAPLSDVVACEFADCAIGVRAIGQACPTVWGCLFKGGDMGVFSMDGSPYIRDNAFVGLKCGVRMMPPDMEPAVIRNNTFVNCADSAVTVLTPKNGFSGPSIRNNVVVDCGAAVVGPANLSQGVSHTLYKVSKTPAFHDESGTETLKGDASNNAAGDAGVTVSDAALVAVGKDDAVEGRGIRLCSDKEGTTGTIGVEKEWRQLGTGATATLPPARFGGKRLIANAVAEEYQYLRVARRPMGGQSMGMRDGVRCDTMKPGDGKEPAELVFDISRFFGEDSLKP